MAPRTVLLTGIGRAGQVGDALARAFAADGAKLFLVGRTEQEAAARAAELPAGSDAAAFGADLSDASATEALASRVRALAGDGLDAVVHVAGGFGGGDVADSDHALWQRQIAINLTTAVLATRALLPLVRLRRGVMIYFGSAAVLPGATGRGMAAYAAAKSGVLALMRAVAAEESERGVRANAVAPTAIDTAANAASGMRGAMVTRESVADTVRFLCSDAARSITGQTIRLG